VLHSRSPFIFNTVFEAEGVNAFYTRIRAVNAPDVAKIIRELRIDGANVTTPFKEELLGCLDEVSQEARLIGGVNTVVNSDGFLTGYNTDHLGVTRALSEAGVDLARSRCLVIGAGGAGKAAVYGLSRAGARVTIANRTAGKARAIASAFGCEAADLCSIPERLGEFDVLVSTLLPNVMPFAGVNLPASMFVLDANYRRSLVAQLAIGSGSRVIGGERWLLHQAVGAYEYFIGGEPNIRIMEAGLHKSLNPSNVSIHAGTAELAAKLREHDYDLIVSSNGLSPEEVNSIIDEEKRKAFGS